MRSLKLAAVAATLALLTFFHVPAADAHEVTIGKIVIGHPWSRQSPKFTDAAAGFLLIQNTGSDDDRLVKATSDLSPTTQIHTMKMDGEVMKMVELPDGITIPAGKDIELKPGSFHIMFMGLKTLPKVGEVFKGTLTFEKAGTVDVEYEVAAPDAGMN
jgi:periplasmic copper chaperone A